MKMTIFSFVILLVSTNSFALETSGNLTYNGLAAGGYSTISVLASTGSAVMMKTEASLIINDSQEFFQSGEVSLYLGSKIASIQALDSSISMEDAIDTLIENANHVLNQ